MSFNSYIKDKLKSAVYYMYIRSEIIMKAVTGELKNRLKKKSSIDEKCLHILMNGPSLDDSIDYISERPGDIMIANWAIKSQSIMDLHPRYLCVFDPVFAENEEYLMLVNSIEKENPAFEIFMPNIIYKKYVSLYGCAAARQVNNICIKKIYDTKFDKKMYENNLEMPMVSTVAVAALYVGIQLGYKNIYLHGNEFSLFHSIYVGKDGTMLRKCSHFYGEQDIKLEDEGMNMLYFADANYVGHLGYNNIAMYAKDENVEIRNMCRSSYIDAFIKM